MNNPAETPQVNPPLYEVNTAQLDSIRDLGAAALVGQEGIIIPAGGEDSTAAIVITDGERKGEIEIINTSPNNFGDSYTHKALQEKFGPKASEAMIAEAEPKNPEAFTVAKKELPAVFDELEMLGPLPDVNKEPSAAQYHDSLVRGSTNNITQEAQNGRISSDSAALRLARNIGAAINPIHGNNALETLSRLLSPETVKQFRDVLGGFSGNGGSIDFDKIQSGVISFSKNAIEQGHPKTAQLTLAVAYGASYKMPNKTQAVNFRDHLSRTLIASFEKTEQSP